MTNKFRKNEETSFLANLMLFWSLISMKFLKSWRIWGYCSDMGHASNERCHLPGHFVTPGELTDSEKLELVESTVHSWRSSAQKKNYKFQATVAFWRSSFWRSVLGRINLEFRDQSIHRKRMTRQHYVLKAFSDVRMFCDAQWRHNLLPFASKYDGVFDILRSQFCFYMFSRYRWCWASLRLMINDSRTRWGPWSCGLRRSSHRRSPTAPDAKHRRCSVRDRTIIQTSGSVCMQKPTCVASVGENFLADANMWAQSFSFLRPNSQCGGNFHPAWSPKIWKKKCF